MPVEYKLDIDYIINIVQDVLDKAHTDPRKKEIKIKLDRANPEINFNCPICLDGKSVKFRSHLYLKNLYVKCYNEDSCSRSFTNFCKHFGIEIDLDKKMQIYNYLDNNWKYSKKDDFTIKSLDKLLDFEESIKVLNDKKGFLFNIMPIVRDSIQWKYLTHRLIFDHSNIYQAYYKITDQWIEPVIVIMNRTEDKLLGMQVRNLKEDKNKRIYKFVSFQELYNIVNPDNPLDEIEAINYNKLSAIFNFLNVDLDSTVYVFEGYLDSVFFPNSIALVGLDTDISMFDEENIDMKFILDNDEPGIRKAKKIIDDGQSVFLWKKLINELSKNKGTKYKNFLENNLKDMNKLVQIVNDANVYRNLNLNKYFAVDQFDLIDI